MAEPLPIAFANTLHAVRGRLRDGLSTRSALAAWLDSVTDQLPEPPPSAPDRLPPSSSGLPGSGPPDSGLRGSPGMTDSPGITDDDLRRARELRDAIRAIASAVVSGDPPAPADLGILNAAARDAPKWRELRWTPQPHATEHSRGTRATAALSAIAAEAVALFAGDLRSELRACRGPGCVLHFIRDSPRREFCSPGCGNRARAARHYAKTKPGSPGHPD
ncbi:CGNR zinc finger domain-containing protein [Actinoplanes sp. NPDC023801]|uniref:CGNR zinc finger domain-containing protein n=1 Tax=Actinoplanes sp. NPDC023801 TaxID=3154595 RepID=UPI003400554F